MQEFNQDYLSDSNEELMDPVGPPMAEATLKEDIFYNGHIIPAESTFKILR